MRLRLRLILLGGIENDKGLTIIIAQGYRNRKTDFASETKALKMDKTMNY